MDPIDVRSLHDLLKRQQARIDALERRLPDPDQGVRGDLTGSLWDDGGDTATDHVPCRVAVTRLEAEITTVCGDDVEFHFLLNGASVGSVTVPAGALQAPPVELTDNISLDVTDSWSWADPGGGFGGATCRAETLGSQPVHGHVVAAGQWTILTYEPPPT